LDGSCFRLTGTGWLNLRPVVWFSRTNSGLVWPGNFTRPCTRLSGTVDFAWSGVRLTRSANLAWATARIGTCDAGLSGDGPRGCNHGRTTLVDVIELLTILRGLPLVLNLGRHGRNARTAHSCDFGCLWPHGDAASATVVSDTIIVVHRDGAVVDVSDSRAYAIDGTVVVKVISVPVPAVIAIAGVAEAIVDASIETNMKAPETAVKAPAVAIPTPVARRPESSIVGRRAPRTGDPIVAGRSPIPITGCPDVVGSRSFGLVVDGQWRRRFVRVFDRLRLAVSVEFIESLRVLIGLVLIGWWRSALLLRLLGAGLRWILFDTLLGLRLRADA
jgi:hypothetical protein